MTTLNELLADVPAPVSIDAGELAVSVRRAGRVLVVLDDDPTGTQSVADLPVVTAWDVEDFRWAFAQDRPAVYVMTNSRSLDPADAERVSHEVATAGLAAAADMGLQVELVSRSDSTLRGHYPLETDVLAEELVAAGQPAPDGVLLVPAFPDAGRVTIDSEHYYVVDGEAIPSAQTEFAKDATFGYHSSNLRDYVAEKSEGRIPADTVVALTLAQIRRGPEAVAEILRGVTDGVPVVVDAAVESDLLVVAAAVESVVAEGKSFLYRVGPRFPRTRIGQCAHAPLEAAEIFAERPPQPRSGLIVVGSHVPTTTRQLETLTLEHPEVTRIEIEVEQVLDPDRRDSHLRDVVDRAAAALDHGQVIVSTTRALRTGASAADSLRIAREVSAAVIATVQGVLAAAPPRFVIAKGGITSSDVATHGLGIRHARVLGPMLPGIVSLWEPEDGPAVGIPYVVFAGNVGDASSLSTVVTKLSA